LKAELGVHMSRISKEEREENAKKPRLMSSAVTFRPETAWLKMGNHAGAAVAAKEWREKARERRSP